MESEHKTTLKARLSSSTYLSSTCRPAIWYCLNLLFTYRKSMNAYYGCSKEAETNSSMSCLWSIILHAPPLISYYRFCTSAVQRFTPRCIPQKVSRIDRPLQFISSNPLSCASRSAHSLTSRLNAFWVEARSDITECINLHPIVSAPAIPRSFQTSLITWSRLLAWAVPSLTSATTSVSSFIKILALSFNCR